MPAMAPVPGVLKYRFFHVIGADTNATAHLFLRTVTPPTQAQAQSAADAASSAWATNFAPLMAIQWSLREVTVTDLSSATGPVGINTTTHAGSRATPANPAGLCAILNIPVPRRYRGGKPRVYWPFGVSTDLATPQTWSTAFLTSANNAWVAFATAVIANLTTWAPSAGLVSVSYYSGHQWLPDQNGNYHRVPTPRATPLVDVVTANATFNTVLGSQRRRVRPG